MPLVVLNRVVFHQDSAIPHNTRMNVVFLNHFGAESVGSRNWARICKNENPKLYERTKTLTIMLPIIDWNLWEIEQFVKNTG
jgi:hypothetical protein